MDSNFVAVFVVFWILWIVLGAVIGDSKGRVGEGLLLGFFLGLIGVIIIAFMSASTAGSNRVPGTMTKCPYCAELVQKEAVLCRFCNSALPTPQPPERDDVRHQGRLYVRPEDESGSAFCLLCRNTAPKSQLYYNRELDTYAHRECLEAQA